MKNHTVTEYVLDTNDNLHPLVNILYLFQQDIPHNYSGKNTALQVLLGAPPESFASNEDLWAEEMDKQPQN